MNKQKQPWWVTLAFSSIPSRKGALILIGACILFTLYCLPWSRFFPQSAWVGKLFLIEGWDWFAMMLPISFWYWLSLKWMDRHSGWPSSASGAEN